MIMVAVSSFPDFPALPALPALPQVPKWTCPQLGFLQFVVEFYYGISDFHSRFHQEILHVGGDFDES